MASLTLKTQPLSECLGCGGLATGHFVEDFNPTRDDGRAGVIFTANARQRPAPVSKIIIITILYALFTLHDMFSLQ